MPKKNKSKSKITESEIVKIEDDSVSVEEESVVELQEEDTQVDDGVDNTDDPKKLVGFNDEYDELVNLREKEAKIRTDKSTFIKDYQKEFDKKMKEFSSLIKKNHKDQELIFKKLKRIHGVELKKASKEKRKRNGKNTGGFNSEAPVPKTLRGFLGLKEDVKLNRPTVFHLMNEQYKERGLKTGQDVKLDKKSAKQLKRPVGFVIKFPQQQPFIASYYNEEKEQVNIDV